MKHPDNHTSSDVTCCQAIYLDITYSFVHFLLIVLMSHHVFMIPTHYPHIGTLCNTSNIRMSVNPIHMVALLTKKQQLFQMYEVLKNHPCPAIRLACRLTNCIHGSAWQTANHHRHSTQESWRRLNPMCANQRRPAYRVEPISAFQRVVAQPIAGLHDGKEVTAYIWRAHYSFNIISQKKDYRTD